MNSSSEFHRKPLLIFIPAVADPVFHCLLIYVTEQQKKVTGETTIGSGFSVQPPPEQKSTVASDETQVMNSNSTPGLKDPLTDGVRTSHVDM